MNPRILVLFAALLALAGCATEPPKPHFLESADQTLQPPPRDKAQIVFLEPINSLQGMLPNGIFEVDGPSNRTLLATTGAHSKAVVLLNPGRHMLMANQGYMGHFLEANVEAGKRYYVLLRFIYANGFQLRPLRRSGPSDYTVQARDFPSWVSTTRFVERTPESDAFFEKFKDQMDKGQAASWKTWLDKTPKERAELTLNPEDAIP